VTIPAQVRRAAGIEPGQRLVVYVERGRVVIEERDHLLARVQREAIAAARAAGHTGSATDELISERRAESIREAAEISGSGTQTAPASGGSPG
jgi:bifunctional DNA-binding transcriptional regulator/antitoxin component of YhaV-PrlF toxin-antitoxin module